MWYVMIFFQPKIPRDFSDFSGETVIAPLRHQMMPGRLSTFVKDVLFGDTQGLISNGQKTPGVRLLDMAHIKKKLCYI